MNCYVTDEGAANLIEAVRNSHVLAVMAAVVTVLLIVAVFSSLAAMRAAREMRALRHESTPHPQYGPYVDPFNGREH
jgi:ABC-type spermidine/putrescine transport system permease subunit II